MKNEIQNSRTVQFLTLPSEDETKFQRWRTLKERIPKA